MLFKINVTLTPIILQKKKQTTFSQGMGILRRPDTEMVKRVVSLFLMVKSIMG